MTWVCECCGESLPDYYPWTVLDGVRFCPRASCVSRRLRIRAELPEHETPYSYRTDGSR